MNLVFISLLFFLPAAAAQHYCRSCIDPLFLNLTANSAYSNDSTIGILSKLVMESEALLSKDCTSPRPEYLEVESDVGCFYLNVTGGVIPKSKNAQMFGPVTFLENTTLMDSVNSIERIVSVYNITEDDGTIMLLRMFDNTIIEAAVKPSAIHLWLRITVVLLAVVVIIGGIFGYSVVKSKKRPSLPPYVRYEERIRVGLQPVSADEEPPAQMEPAISSSGVLLVSYVRHNETVTIADEDGTPLGEPATPVDAPETTATSEN